jgi:hypothetical protein
MTSALTSEVAQGRKLRFSFFELETGEKGLYDHTNGPTLPKLRRDYPGNTKIDVDWVGVPAEVSCTEMLQGMAPKLAFFIFIYRPTIIIFIKQKLYGTTQNGRPDDLRSDLGGRARP